MRRLVEGVHQFRSQVFPKEQEFYEVLAKGQSPSTLFITCSDSRIDPNLMTQTGPGELFVLRNAGNIVPPFRASTGGESASIEYAVSALGVSDVVVCGHSQCGAIKALLDPKQTANLPLMRDWLEHAEATRQIVQHNYGKLKGTARLEVAIQEHVLVQIENLQTHPSVLSRLLKGDLTLHAWVYDLASGAVHTFSTERGEFVPVGSSAS